MAPSHEAQLELLTKALRERRLTICVGPQLAEAAGLPTPLLLAKQLLGQLRHEQPEFDVSELEQMAAAGEDAEALEALEYEFGEARFRGLH